MNKNCVRCGKELSENQTRKHHNTFCSRSCSTRSRPHYGRSRTGATIKCAFCGKEFYVEPRRASVALFCSRTCGAKNRFVIDPGFGFKKSPVPQYAGGYVNGVRIREHRFVMEQHLGRKLGRRELVHHINGDSLDNRIENLMIVTPEEHARLHMQPKLYIGE